MKNKIKEWFNRYILAEIISYSLAIGGGTLYFNISGDYYISGIIVIIGDNLGYYLTMFLKEIYLTYKINKKYNLVLFLKDIRNLSFEFGPPQFLETFVIYPLLVFYIPKLFDNYPFGIFLAMTIAIIIFYIQAIILYEIRKKYFR